ncbi:MAG: Hsp20/alpha crystallin family protein [Syntrophorhabdaceae bacterium]|nr:Hsp20/alpha crystallin family protein [Syntrophorhabdaceae bacterium]
MTIIRWWDPAKELSSLQHRVNRAFGETFCPSMGNVETRTNGAWHPAVDIFETEQEIVLKVEIPGLTKDQVNVEVNEGTLHLKGERKFEKDVKEESYHRIERVYGGFQRSFALPDAVDPEKVNAELKDGILEVRLGKREQAKPRQIQVTVN